MSHRTRSYIYRPIRPAVAPPPPITPDTAPDRLLWLDASAGVAARGAVQLNGTDQHLARATPVVASYPFSVALWFRPTADGSILWGQFSSATSNWTGHYFYAASGRVRASTAAENSFAEAVSTDTYALDAWNLAVGVWASATSRAIYLNGGEASTDATDLTPAAMHNAILGAGIPGGNVAGHFAGRLDDCGVWGRALSAAEAAQLYNGGAGYAYGQLPPGLAAGLASWYELGELSGDRRDRHGANHLTPVNGPAGVDGVVEGPAADLDPVHCWSDRVSGLEFTEATAPGRPDFRSPGHLAFDGVDDRLSRPGPIVGGSPEFTLLARVRVDALPSSDEAVLYCEEDATAAVQFRVAVTPTGAVKATYRPSGGPAGSVDSTAPLPVGSEAVIAVRRDATTLSLFLDGSPAGSGPIAPGTDLAGVTSRIGAPVASAGSCLNGRVAHLYALGRALTDDQVSSLGGMLGG